MEGIVKYPSGREWVSTNVSCNSALFVRYHLQKIVNLTPALRARDSIDGFGRTQLSFITRQHLEPASPGVSPARSKRVTS
jgi:hypothetical protein